METVTDPVSLLLSLFNSGESTRLGYFESGEKDRGEIEGEREGVGEEEEKYLESRTI